MCILCASESCAFQAGPLTAATPPAAVGDPSLDPALDPLLDTAIDALPTAYVWAGTTVTYSFTDSAADYAGSFTAYGEEYAHQPLSAAGEDMMRAAFAAIDAVTALDFAETARGGDIAVGGSTVPSTAWAYLPGTGAGGDIWIGVHKSYNALFVAPEAAPYLGSYEHYVALHEIGHAIGLKHPHEIFAGNGLVVPAAYDAVEYTVMSYRSYPGGPAGSLTVAKGHFPQSPMMLDIAAIQQLYGADWRAFAGDTVYAFAPDSGEMLVNGVGTGLPMKNIVFRTLWDGGGRDRIDLSAYATDLAVDLRPGGGIDLDSGGSAQKAQLAMVGGAPVHAAYHVYMSLLADDDPRSLIEEATGGTGDDVFIGNAAANRFTGGAGNDRFTGGLGADVFALGSGADTLSDTLAGLDGDTLLDFDIAVDRLVVEGIEATLARVSYDIATGLLSIAAGSAGSAALTLADRPAWDAPLALDASGTLVLAGDGGETPPAEDPPAEEPPAEEPPAEEPPAEEPGGPRGGVMAAGTLLLEQAGPGQWVRVAFGTTIENASVIVGPVGHDASVSAMPRVRDVTATGFELQIDEWDHLDGRVPLQEISWIAGSQGSWSLASGQRIAFGSAEIAGSGRVALPDLGAAAPRVFAQVASAADPAAVIERVSAVDRAGFSLALQEEEAADGRHAPERVDWLAVAAAGDVFDLNVDTVRSTFTRVQYERLEGERVLLAEMQTANDRDPAALHIKGWNGNAYLRAQEEMSADAEIEHGPETVALMSLEAGLYDLFA